MFFKVGELVLARAAQPRILGGAETTLQEVHGRLEPVVAVFDLFRGLSVTHHCCLQDNCIEVGHEFRVGIVLMGGKKVVFWRSARS